jgi:outer membrane murein-binding lipoprotein Lpp
MLFADLVVSLPLSIALTLAGVVAGGAIAWGVISATVRQLQQTVRELRVSVETLSKTCADLATRVTVMERLDDERASRVESTSRQRPQR